MLILLLVITFAGLFIPETDAKCKVEDNIYEVGEGWKEEFECEGHYCLEDGTYNTTLCPPTPEYVPEGWILRPEQPETLSFPHCCAHIYKKPEPFFNSSLPGCTVDGTTYKVGDQRDVPGHCNYNVCQGNDEWAVASCGDYAIPPAWGFAPEDLSKPYPECCPRVISPHNIVPDVLDNLQWADFLEVTYDGDLKVDDGDELTPTQVKDQPEVEYRGSAKAYYLFFMIDPDAPSREDPKRSEFLHWMVVNIPGNNTYAGEVLAEYVGSAPPKMSGLHRYIFFLYRQPSKLKLNFDEHRSSKISYEHRLNFSTRKFVEKYKLGNPKAFNLFQAQYDDYVPEVYKQILFSASLQDDHQ